MSMFKLPVNVFDVILLVVLAAGLYRGRKHGMSEELLSLIKWLCVLIVCALVYEPVGTWLSKTSPFSLLSCFLMAYIAIGLIVIGLFALVKHSLGGKLIGSDVFGRTEYYLGMASGMVRFACMLLAVLALLNARYFSQAEVRAMEAFQNDVYGSNFFPGLHTAQATVFQNSLTGRWIGNHLGFLLIKPTKPEQKQIHQQEFNFP